MRESKTKVAANLPSASESNWAPVIIIGEASGCKIAYKMIKDLANGEVDDVVAEFYVPRQKVLRLEKSVSITYQHIFLFTHYIFSLTCYFRPQHPWLIGPKGKTIRRISAESNVRIFIPDINSAVSSSGKSANVIPCSRSSSFHFTFYVSVLQYSAPCKIM